MKLTTPDDLQAERLEKQLNIILIISDGPHNVTFLPQTLSYTVNESTGSVSVTCKANGCKPDCEVKWIGPNFTGNMEGVLNLQNIEKKQAGNYFCTASNEAWNITSVNIRIIVNCKQNMPQFRVYAFAIKLSVCILYQNRENNLKFKNVQFTFDLLM